MRGIGHGLKITRTQRNNCFAPLLPTNSLLSYFRYFLCSLSAEPLAAYAS